MSFTSTGTVPAPRRPSAFDRVLNGIEWAGNKLPDPAILFVIALFVVWVVSALLAPVAFEEIDPRNGMPLRVQNQLTGTALAGFLSNMVTVFVTFPPLGIVLVGVLYILRQVSRLNPEIGWIERFRRNQADPTRVPRLIGPLARLLAERKSGRVSLTAASMRSLLDGIGTRLEETRETARYMIGLLVFLGLLGTFYGLLQTVVDAWYAGAAAASSARLVTRNAISLAFFLPVSYEGRIRAVEGLR